MGTKRVYPSREKTTTFILLIQQKDKKETAINNMKKLP